MKGLPEGWNYYYFDTFKQDDGTLTAGIGVTNGEAILLVLCRGV